MRVVNPSPLRAIARHGEIHCPVKQGIIAYGRCVATQRETAMAGQSCVCGYYRAYAGELPSRDDPDPVPEPPEPPPERRGRRR